METTTTPTPGSPVAPAVTDRIMTLLGEASMTLAQVEYEGTARKRQEPRPSHGSPWDTPDLPEPVKRAVKEAQDALDVAMSLAATYRRRGR